MDLLVYLLFSLPLSRRIGAAARVSLFHLVSCRKWFLGLLLLERLRRGLFHVGVFLGSLVLVVWRAGGSWFSALTVDLVLDNESSMALDPA